MSDPIQVVSALLPSPIQVASVQLPSSVAINQAQLLYIPSNPGAGLAGISAGTTQATSGAVVFSNSNGLAFGLSGNTLTASYAENDMLFSNANGVTFGTVGSTVTASVQTAYQSQGAYLTTAQPPGAYLTTAQPVGAYLTTAMLSNASSAFAGTGITTTTTAGSNIVGTHGTAGLSLGVPAFLTTAAAGGGFAAQGSGTYTQNSGTIQFSNANGITFGLTNNAMTASHNGLTTAMASNASSAFAGTGFTSTTTAGTAVVGTHNTAGLSMGFPVFVTNALTTAMASNAGSAFAGTGFTSTTTAGSAIVGTHGTNGLSLGVPAFLTTAQSAGAYLTTAMGSNAGSLFLNTGTTGATNASVTLASNGLSVSVGNYITTAMASNAGSGFVAASATIAGTNISGTIASNGMSLSVAAPGGGGGAALQGSGTYTQSTGTVQFSNSNGVTFGLTAGTMTASHNGLTTAMASNASTAFAATGFTSTTTAGTAIVATHNTAGLSLGVPAFLTTAQSAGAYLTTARASNDGIGTNTALTANGVSMTANSGGLSLNFPAFLTTAQSPGAYLTTAMASNAGSNFLNTGTTGATNASVTLASNGLSVSVGNYITTAMLSNAGSNFIAATATVAGTNISGTFGSIGISLSAAGGTGAAGAGLSAGTQSVNTGTVSFANSNGISFGMSGSNQITASYTVPSVPVQTAQTMGLYVLGNTSNASSTTIDARSFSVSAMGELTAGISAGAVFFTYTPDVLSLFGSGNTTNNSSGSFLLGNSGIVFSGAGGVSAGVTGNTVIISSPVAMGSNAGSNFVAASATVAGTNVSGTISSNGMSLSVGATALSSWWPWEPASTSSQTYGAFGTSTASAMVFPFFVDDVVKFNCVNLLMSMSFVSSTSSGQQTIRSNFGLFSNNAGTLSLISSSSFSMCATVSSVSATLSYPSATGTAGYTYTTLGVTTTAQAHSLFGTAGNRIVQLQFGNSMLLNPGMYWLGLQQWQSTASAAVGVSTALVGNAMNGSGGVGGIGLSTAQFTASSAYHLGAHGVFTNTALAGHSGTNLPGTMGLTAFNNNLNVMPLFTFLST